MPRGNHRRMFTARDYASLGLSLVLAFAVWFIYNLSQNYSGIVQRQIELRCAIPQYHDISSSSSVVVARCEMDGYHLLSLRYHQKKNSRPKVIHVSAEDIHHYANDDFYMTAADIAKYSHEIFGNSAKLEYMVSDTLIFRFARQFNKKVPVNMIKDLNYRSQYMPLGKMTPSPDSVYIYGDKRALDLVDRVNTKMISISDISGDIFGEVALEPIKGVRFSTDNVTYSQNVSRYVEQKLEVPVKVKNEPRGYELLVFPQTALISMNVRFPSDMQFDNVYVEVDFNDVASGTNGKCMGHPCNLSDDVISYTVEPELFDGLVQQL